MNGPLSSPTHLFEFKFKEFKITDFYLKINIIYSYNDKATFLALFTLVRCKTGIFTAFQKRSPSTLHNRKHTIHAGATMSMMLSFIWSSRIGRANVGIVFKSLSFGPFTLKRNPGVFKLKRAFLKVSVVEG